MAIILPKQGSIWETLGGGLGSGLQRLAQGKVQQMHKQGYANSLQQMGMSPDIAYLPENLQPLAIKQHQAKIDRQQHLEQLGEQSKRLKAIYGLDVSPEFLATKEGQGYAKELMKSDIRQFEQEHKQFLKPTTTGEALVKALSLGLAGGRQKPRMSPVEREKAYGQAQQELKQIQALSPQQREEIAQSGFDIDAYENKLVNQIMSPQGTGSSSLSGMGAQEQPTSGLQALTSTGIGAAKGAAGISPLFLPQNIASLGLSGINALGRFFGAEGNIAPSYEDIQKRIPTVKNASDDAMQVMKQYGLLPEDAPDESMLSEAPFKPFPTSSQVAQKAQGLAAGTPLEKYVIPQSETQQGFEDFGALIPALFSGKAAEGIIGKTKEAAKATAKAFGAKAAGEFAKEITGSDLIGKGVTFGAVLAMNMFPGTFAQNAEREYKAFEDGVIKPAEAAGKRVQLGEKFNDAINKWEKQSIKGWAKGTAEHKALSDEMRVLQELEAGRRSIDPAALWNNIRRSNAMYDKIPENARGDFLKLIDIQKNALKDFGNTISQSATESLQKGNDIYRAMFANQRIAKNIQDHASLRGLGYGTLAWMLGKNMPLVLGGAMAFKGGTYLKQLMSVPSIRQTTLDLFKASASRNIGAMNTLSKKLDKQIKKAEPEYYAAMNKLKPQ